MIIGCTGNYRKEEFYKILHKIHAILSKEDIEFIMECGECLADPLLSCEDVFDNCDELEQSECEENIDCEWNDLGEICEDVSGDDECDSDCLRSRVYL